MNKNKSFSEILTMIKSACNDCFYNGLKGKEDVVIQCATQIYIAQMKEGTDE